MVRAIGERTNALVQFAFDEVRRPVAWSVSDVEVDVMHENISHVMVEDLGRVINPLTATGQAIGAVVQGLGGTLLEHLQYDEQGQFLTASLADYLLPGADDFPNIRAIITGNSPSPNNPLGAKGGGEGGIVPVAGVVANAVAAALAPLNVEPRELPLSPPRVWGMMNRRVGSKGA